MRSKEKILEERAQINLLGENAGNGLMIELLVDIREILQSMKAREPTTG